MNKLLRSALAVAAVAGISGYAATASAKSFTAVIDKIEMVQDADQYNNSRVTVYEPAADIGEATTKTVDLFDSTDRSGVAFTVSTDALTSGEVYEAMVIHFSSINAVSGSETFDVATQFSNAGTMANVGGLFQLVLGEDGTGASSVETIYTNAAATMQSVIAGGALTLPGLTMEVTETDVVDDGSGSIEVASLPPVASVAVTTGSDNASRANVLVDVSTGSFDAVSGITADSSVVTVGLFQTTSGSTVLDNRTSPLYSKTLTYVSPTVFSQVEFVDVAATTANTKLFPIAWIDSDSDGKLDAGEFYAVSNTTVATGAFSVSAAESITGSSDEISTTGTTLSTSFGPVSSTAVAFGQRAITLSIAMPAENQSGTTIVNDGWAGAPVGLSATVTLDAGGDNSISTTDANPATGTLIIAYAQSANEAVSRTLRFTLAWGADGAGLNDTIQTSEEAFAGILDSTDSSLTVSGVSYVTTTTGGSLTISDVPLFIDSLGNAENQGSYVVDFRVTVDDSAVAGDTTNSISTAQRQLREDGNTNGDNQEDHSAHTIFLRGDVLHNETAADTDGVELIGFALDD